MKKTKQYISLLLAVLLTAGLSSCIKEDYAGASDETATVNLVFDTRASGQDGDKVQGEANEGIKTLRVIIVDTDNNRVDVNELRDFSGETLQPVLQKTLTIMGLPVGNKDFYVIANEASVGLSDLDTPRPGYSFGEAEKSALLSTLINDGQRTYFPSTDTEIEEKRLAHRRDCERRDYWSGGPNDRDSYHPRCGEDGTDTDECDGRRLRAELSRAWQFLREPHIPVPARDGSHFARRSSLRRPYVPDQ